MNNYLNPDGETLPAHGHGLLPGVYILTVFLLVVIRDPGPAKCGGGGVACSDGAVYDMLAGGTMDLSQRQGSVSVNQRTK